ncbi:hypothetical protein [Brevibacterium litoralis]|uniref:hypothetical protein n=1 Tax=Brevibacterium litoralis TaxID=3138935 RepID=UPI0032EFCC29
MPSPSPRPSAFADLWAGLRYVFAHPLFRVLVVLFVVLNVATNGMLLALVLDLTVRGQEPVLIGLVSAVVGVGTLVGAALAPALVKRIRTGLLVPLALGFLALGGIALVFAPGYWAQITVLGLAFLGAPACNAALVGYASAITPQEMQGRFASIIGLTGYAAAPLAPVVGAGLLEIGGLPLVFLVLSGVLGTVVVGLCFFRPLRRIGTPDTWVPTPNCPVDGEELPTRR